MYSVSDLRKNLKVEIDGIPYNIVEFSFMKPGKGQAVYTCRLKNMLTGTTMVQNYRSNESLDECHIEEKSLRFSYKDGTNYIFTDENYEEVIIPESVLGQGKNYLVDDIKVSVLFHNITPIEVTFPNFIEKKVIYTEPGARGDTANNVTKPATLEGDFQIAVPLFVNQGDIIKIDTRTGEYADRVSKG